MAKAASSQQALKAGRLLCLVAMAIEQTKTAKLVCPVQQLYFNLFKICNVKNASCFHYMWLLQLPEGSAGLKIILFIKTTAAIKIIKAKIFKLIIYFKILFFLIFAGFFSGAFLCF
jgi:hypothetical protein